MDELESVREHWDNTQNIKFQKLHPRDTETDETNKLQKILERRLKSTWNSL